MQCYCPFEGCGHRTTYEIAKPTKCPRCNRAYAAAFVVTPLAPAPVTCANVDDDDDSRPLTRSALLKARANVSTTKVKPRRGQANDSHMMNPPTEVDAPDLPDDEEEDEYVDERMLTRRARELAASIDPSTIHTLDDYEGFAQPVKFGKMWNEGERTRGVDIDKPAKKRGTR